MTYQDNLDQAYDRVIDALLLKTQEGKVHWQVTAQSDTFVAPVRGVQTFEVSRRSRTHFGPGLAPPPTIRIVVRDTNGDVVFETEKDQADSTAHKLFEAARRVAINVDKKIDESLELLNSL